MDDMVWIIWFGMALVEWECIGRRTERSSALGDDNRMSSDSQSSLIYDIIK